MKLVFAFYKPDRQKCWLGKPTVINNEGILEFQLSSVSNMNDKNIMIAENESQAFFMLICMQSRFEREGISMEIEEYDE